MKRVKKILQNCFLTTFRYIRTTSFLKQNGDRDGVPNIVIVITDGKSNVPVSTSAEADRLKIIATIFSIGIGSQVGYKELRAIATDEKHTFTVNNFDALVEIKQSLAIKTCEGNILNFRFHKYILSIL